MSSGIRVSIDSPDRHPRDWSSIASDIATALGAPDDAVSVAGVQLTDSGNYRIIAEIYAPRVTP